MLRIATVALALVVAACGGSSTSSDQPRPSQSAAPAGTEVAVATEIAPAIPPVSEGLGGGLAPAPATEEPEPTAVGSSTPGGDDPLSDVSTGALIIQPDALPVLDAGVDTPCSAEGTAASTSDARPNSYSIANATDAAYTVYWLDADGRRQRWFELTPGASNTQRTYESHAWLVADAQDRCLAIFHAPADLTIQPKPQQGNNNGGPLFPTAAPSEQPSSPTEEAAGRATMLAQGDMPIGAVGDGVQLVREELAGFSANGGLRTLTQKWETEGDLYVIYDDRWQFPTAGAAKGFLESELRELTYATQGLAPQAGIEAAGRDGVVYGGRLEMTGGTVQSFYSFVFSDGPIVARVFASGAEDMDPARVVDIAGAAAGRVAQVAGSESNGAFPSVAEQQLLGHVPAPIRQGCSRDPNTPDFTDASVICQVRSGATVVKYLQVRDAGTLAQLLRARLQAVGAESTGQSCREGPSNQPWSINGTKGGDVFCYAQDAGAGIEWTDERLNIYSLAAQASANWPALYDWWANEAGPQ